MNAVLKKDEGGLNLPSVRLRVLYGCFLVSKHSLLLSTCCTR